MKTKDLLTSEMIRDLVHTEVNRMKHLQSTKEGGLDGGDIAKLEKIAKIYSILAADQRESLKSGLGHLDDGDLELLAGELADEGTATPAAAEGDDED